MTGWVLVLILFLWVSGGFGWIDSYEAREGTQFNLPGQALVMVLWPLMGLVAAVSQVWGGILDLAGGEK